MRQFLISCKAYNWLPISIIDPLSSYWRFQSMLMHAVWNV